MHAMSGGSEMTAAQSPAAPALQVTGLHKRFGDLEVLRGVDLCVEHGQIAAIIGPSGGGKSTLLRCINYLEVPDRGQILIKGVPFGRPSRDGGPAQTQSRRDFYSQRARMPMVFQRFNLFGHLTAIENVMLGRTAVLRKPQEEALAQGRDLLARVGLAEKSHSYPSQLSGGQQQRVAIARALAMDPDIVLFDEPTSSLDPELVGGVLDVIEDLASDGLTMVIVTHEMAFARSTADLVYFVDQGRVSEEGSAEKVFDAPTNPRTEAFIKGISAGRRKRD